MALTKKQIAANRKASDREIAKRPTYTKAQQIMIADGLPSALIMSPEQRAEVWRKNPPKPMPAFNAPPKEEGEDTKRFRAMLEAQERSRVADSPFLSAKRAERASRPPRPSREGLISVGDIAASLKVLPRVARAALRAAKMPKPDVGWAFAATDVPRITKIIKDALECDTSTSAKKSSAKSTKLKPSSMKQKPSSKSVAAKAKSSRRAPTSSKRRKSSSAKGKRK